MTVSDVKMGRQLIVSCRMSHRTLNLYVRAGISSTIEANSWLRKASPEKSKSYKTSLTG
ncbi:MAG: hypothetical protein KPI85_02025 [cyanobacterium endosymbiont of Epithemia adnata isolate EadnSB Bon19]